jgi:lipopolysaccharide/colanic/teichoic acid biosynthesis glycosyltransferase
MSIVGPRPHTPATTAAGYELELVVPNYTARYRVKPGITGWAQVCGLRGNLDSIEKAVQRVEHDLYYIDNWSLGFDILVILKSLRVVLYDRRAF